MANKMDSRRLDELVKQTLNNYEAPAGASDWSKMEAMLGAAPKSVSSNFQMPSFSLEGAGLLKRVFSSYVFITVLMLSGGGYLLYTILKAPKADNTATTALPPVDSVVNKPVATPPVVSTAVPAENSVEDLKKESAKDTVAVVKSEPVKVEESKEEKAKLEKEKKEAELAEKKKLEKEKAEAEKLRASEKKREEKKEEARKAEKKEKEREKERALKAEKEKKEAPKETLKKSNSPIGLSNFLRSVNVDSLKKQQNQEQQQPKDSVKTQ